MKVVNDREVSCVCQAHFFRGTKFSLFSQENKDIYYLLKNSIVGGPSIVFNRYHEKNKTRLRDRKNGKVCKKVIGFDANALYLWALSLLMPTGDPTQKIYENGTTPNELTQILSDIKNDKLFGFIELDIHTPEHLKTKFSEFTPIFKNTIIREQDIGDHMQNHYKENDKKSPKRDLSAPSFYSRGGLCKVCC